MEQKLELIRWLEDSEVKVAYASGQVSAVTVKDAAEFCCLF